MKTILENIISREHDPIVHALQKHLGKRLVAVVLFGSCARGEAKVESYRDLL